MLTDEYADLNREFTFPYEEEYEMETAPNTFSWAEENRVEVYKRLAGGYTLGEVSDWLRNEKGAPLGALHVMERQFPEVAEVVKYRCPGCGQYPCSEVR